ncbi:MAG: hypothetical protein DMG30_04115 [Acidobacteria bacterium]|nr:MAG: hypothetical protein DMG30_04115 [Acidobacteriota bacterium]
MATLPSWGESHQEDEPSSVTKSAGSLEPTFQRTARIWWAWVWRSVLFGGAAGLFGSVILSLSGILDHLSERAGQYLSAAIGIALAVPVGIWVFQMVLEKDFGEFRIRLVPKAPPSASSSPSFDQSS